MKRVFWPMADEEDMQTACWDIYSKKDHLMTLESWQFEAIFGRVPKDGENVKVTFELIKE